MRLIIVAVLTGFALSSCATSTASKRDHGQQDQLTASGWRPAPLKTDDVAVRTSARVRMPSPPASPRPSFPASPNFDIPAAPPPSTTSGFTGCTGETPDCFVDGQWVDSLARFEPQTGRHWFLDPNTGNTYYADNGEFRTGDAFQEALRQGLISF